MTRTRARAGVPTAVLVAALLGLTACSGDSGDSKDSSADDPTGSSGPTNAPEAEEDAADSAPDAVRRARFCGALDADAYAAELGLEPGSLELVRDLQPGKKYRPYLGADPVVAESWQCNLSTPQGSGTATFVFATISGEKATPATVAASFATSEEVNSLGEQASCTAGDVPEWGQEGRSLACSRPLLKKGGYQTGHSQVLWYGLFGDAEVRCGVGVTPDPRTGKGDMEKELPRMQSASEMICPEVLSVIAE